MRTLILGIDSGTQSTKVLVLDASKRQVIASASQSYDLIPNLPAGTKEPHPDAWRQATAKAVGQAFNAARTTPAEVKAIGVSGQQHGFVPLDRQGEVIRPTKLWCDTSTAPECDEITAALGGAKATVRALGNAVLPGLTASKILWLKRHEPRNYERPATVLLPHDYLNFWLTGQAFMEYGDASGTGLLDVRRRKWSAAALRAINADLEGKPPAWRPSDYPAGELQPATARALGLAPGVLVSAGGGDNMMGAIGTGNTRPGITTASFGTSGIQNQRGVKDLVLANAVGIDLKDRLDREDWGALPRRWDKELRAVLPRPCGCPTCVPSFVLETRPATRAVEHSPRHWERLRRVCSQARPDCLEPDVRDGRRTALRDRFRQHRRRSVQMESNGASMADWLLLARASCKVASGK